MPQIILNKPIDQFNQTEKDVLNRLNKLPDAWYVVAGYHYFHQEKNMICEGDFLVMGPNGGLLILEVKGHTEVFKNKEGKWMLSESQVNPFDQLGAQRSAVLDSLRKVQKLIPSVVASLCVPNMHDASLEKLTYLNQYKSPVLSSGDLMFFEEWWKSAFRSFADQGFLNPATVDCFLKSEWGKEFRTDPARIFNGQIDSILLDLATSVFPALDHLEHYKRMRITGGPGSGKSWLLIEKVLRLAKQWEGEEGKFLVLCFNLEYRDFLKELFENAFKKLKLKERKGIQGKLEIHVRAWEEIVLDPLKETGIEGPPDDPAKLREFWGVQVPEAIQLMLVDGDIESVYDAIFVDEAQDHNTELENTICGYWDLYEKLIKDSGNSPMVVAYDDMQRQPFMRKKAFDRHKLVEWMGSDAVHVHCPSPLRYSKPIVDFLVDLSKKQGAIEFLKESPSYPLPDGSPVIQESVRVESISEKVSEIVHHWIEEQSVNPQDILIIGKMRTSNEEKLDSTIAGYSLKPLRERKVGEIAYISAGRCKGLDARAVIVVGFNEFENEKWNWQHSYSLAVSRARQYLAVIEYASTQDD